MLKLKRAIKSNIWLLGAVTSFIAAWVLYSFFYAPNFEKEVTQFQDNIGKLEQELEAFSETTLKKVKENSNRNLWQTQHTKSKFDYYVFENEDLVYWTDNKLSEIDFDITTKIAETDNGYFLINIKEFEELKILNAIRIKSNFPYENESLENSLIPSLQLPQKLEISFVKEQGYPIYGLSGAYFFNINPSGGKNTTPNQELLIFGTYLLGIFCFLIGFAQILLRINIAKNLVFWSFLTFILLLRYFSLTFDVFSVFNDFDIFDPLIYASSNWFPNLAEFSINVILIAVVTWWIIHSHQSKKTFVSYLSYFLLVGFALAISLIFKNIIENSTIPLEVEQLFRLNRYSFVALLGIAILFYCYFILAKNSLKRIKRSNLPLRNVALLWFFTSILLFLISVFYLEHPYFISMWIILLNGVMLYIEYKFKGNYTFGLGVMIISIFSLYSALNLSEYNLRNEYQKRELYANSLSTEYNPTVEVEYLSVKENIKQSKYLSSVISNPDGIPVSEFKAQLEEDIFNKFWERYEISFYLFDAYNEPIVNYKNSKGSDIFTLNNQIKQHAKPSEFAEGMYYVEDYFDKLSYISKEKIITNDSVVSYLFATYKSKRIPEQIGFPRLLINEKAKVFEELEQYSMAKYRLGKLVMRYNSHNFPLDENAFTNQFKKDQGFVEDEEMSHFIYSTDDLNTIVLSKKKLTKLSVLTTFSYLFTFFGILLLIPTIAESLGKPILFKGINLSFKIQLVLISLVVVSLLVFGLVSGTFVKSQYNSYTNDNIQERIYSVNTEVKQKLGDKDVLDKVVLGNYMEYILQKFSRVFVTDINLYSLEGKLLASSQPKIYKIGLITEQMDPIAYKELQFKKRSEFIHNENIGNLNYLSAYIPFINKDGKLLAYLNLQYFAKQNEYENQISSFLVAIINLAVLLIVSTIVIAIFVTNWITTPLKLIQNSFSSVELGKTTKPIDYSGDDEIGAMVREYNAKLSELELKALQLAKSERESAWREMAKQVAHEIKNPLTPMKLRLQHFERSFNPTDENAQDKLKKTTASLIEQIDALTNIANEFSNFAKMPKPNEEKLNIVPLVENCILLFKDVQEVAINFKTQAKEIYTYADKNLMLRVFNNLVKNSIQAIPENTIGVLDININLEEKFLIVSVKDNGIGISDDKKNKIFVPNFTTKSTGTGLGLAMVKQIVENHNGMIWFETSENIGTTFFVKLPRQIK